MSDFSEPGYTNWYEQPGDEAEPTGLEGENCVNTFTYVEYGVEKWTKWFDTTCDHAGQFALCEKQPPQGSKYVSTI